jgi:hypothetical protein
VVQRARLAHEELVPTGHRCKIRAKQPNPAQTSKPAPLRPGPREQLLSTKVAAVDLPEANGELGVPRGTKLASEEEAGDTAPHSCVSRGHCCATPARPVRRAIPNRYWLGQPLRATLPSKSRSAIAATRQKTRRQPAVGLPPLLVLVQSIPHVGAIAGLGRILPTR